jgi:uncharacterized protein YjgD (DUF1641 family)
MGYNGLLRYLASRAPVWATGASGKMLQLGANAMASTVGTAIMEGTAVGSGILAARESRRTETGLEAIQAATERVAKEIQGGYSDGHLRISADMNKVTDAVLNSAAKMGIDTSTFDTDDIIKFALTYNVNTGDAVFEKAKHDARKGLNKLINQNNALAIVDYLQALPFMSYSASTLKNWANLRFNRGFGNYGQIMPKLTKKYIEHTPIM